MTNYTIDILCAFIGALILGALIMSLPITWKLEENAYAALCQDIGGTMISINGAKAKCIDGNIEKLIRKGER